jgi:hypothetical protein
MRHTTNLHGVRFGGESDEGGEVDVTLFMHASRRAPALFPIQLRVWAPESAMARGLAGLA